ncbi:hypothetical protein V8B97DRAFT_1660054 [Scleroderma yunnanense]
MSDIRTLLKARRQEARVNHPSAAYSSSGQLRCVVCETNIKHATAWEGHLGSKMHRMNATRLRQEAQLREQQEREEETAEAAAALTKRKADEGNRVETGSSKKRQRTESGDEGGSGPSQSSVKHLPANFFSDPSQAPSHVYSDDSDDDKPTSGPPPMDQHVSALTTNTALDEEWSRFQDAVINAPDQREAYDRATVVAEPELVSDETVGFPSQLHVHDQISGQQDQARDLTSHELEKEKQQEERELIMDRLIEEERAQEEADMRVSVMKNRLEAIRRKREAIRSAKPKPIVHAPP